MHFYKSVPIFVVVPREPSYDALLLARALSFEYRLVGALPTMKALVLSATSQNTLGDDFRGSSFSVHSYESVPFHIVPRERRFYALSLVCAFSLSLKTGI
jgi:hypothetical protein